MKSLKPNPRNTPLEDYNQSEYDTQPEHEGLTIKEKLGYTLVAGIGLSAIIYYGTKLINKKKAQNSDAKSFDDGSPQTVAKQIKMAFENDGQFGTDTKALRVILTNVKSKADLEAIRKQYQTLFNSPMYSDMSKELQSTEYNEMLQIMEGKPEKPGLPPTEKQYSAWAKRLKAAFDKTYSFIPGTDETAIKAVFIEIPTQTAFVNVGKSYAKIYQSNLITDLKSELEFYEYSDYMKIITSKRKA